MLRDSSVLRRGAKIILGVSVLALLFAAGSIIGDAISAVISSTILGF